MAGAETGFGLPMSYRIIRAHGGQLQVESREGGGTRVSARLPVG